MNRKHHTNDAQNQGWVTLNDQQLSQVQGGLNYEEIKWTFKSDAAPTAYLKVKMKPVYITSYQTGGS